MKREAHGAVTSPKPATGRAQVPVRSQPALRETERPIEAAGSAAADEHR